MKTIQEYQILSHGVENSQYFQGCGTAYTAFTDVVTGIGDTEHEACEDALEQLAEMDWDVSTVENKGNANTTVGDVLGTATREDDESEECECYFYVSIRVR